MRIDRFVEVLKQEVTDVDSNTTYLIVSAYHKKDLLNEFDHMAEKGKNIYMIVPYLNIQMWMPSDLIFMEWR